MIHEFKVRNFLSFREEQVLSFEATSDKSFEDLYCVEMTSSIKLLKMCMVYGANASGKTNLLVALKYLTEIILTRKEDKLDAIGIEPFKLDKSSSTESTSFYLSFFVKSIRYIYELEFNHTYIVSEILKVYLSSQPTKLFDRYYSKEEGVSKVSFSEKTEMSKNDKIILEGGTIKNSTLLSVYMNSNVKMKHLEDVLDWFKNNLMGIIAPRTKLLNWTSDKITESEECKSFVTEALRKADFNISEIIFEETDRKIDEDFMEFLQKKVTSEDGAEKLKELNSKKLKSISLVHKTKNGEFKLPFKAQSMGTQRYYGLGGILSVLMTNGKILPIDELESSLHYELVNHFLKTFLANSTDSQLLFTTHNISILQEDFIRRDAVWFCEKNDEGATELFSASDFGLHKNTSLYNAYRIGKLGAKPETGSIYLDSYNG